MSVDSMGQAALPAARVGMWAATGFALYVGLGIATLFAFALTEDFLFGLVGIEVAAGTVGLSIRNGVHHVAWGVAVALAAVPIGRRVVPSARFAGLPGLLVLATGALLAGVTEFVLNEWARERFTYFDPDYVGFAGFAPPATLAIALSAWAALCVPRASRGVLLVVLAMAIVGLAVSLLPSVPGALDGIDPESVPLAAILALDATFAAAALVIASR